MARQLLEREEFRAEERTGEALRRVLPYERIIGFIGGAAFVLAFALSVVSGFVAPNNPGVTSALVIMGLVISLLNISTKEVIPILVASVALIVGGTVDVFTPLNTLIAGFGSAMNNMVAYFATFMIPVAVVTAIRAVFKIARPGEQM